ncbi:putative coiled-coil protein MTMR15 [Rhizoctonia solani 123E]|uniref:Fanconi-associated nuclease n=1 Tax=Rhizoctonia solani 123E TaxID=1423351 RepID=A0A074RU61_9AGAM|nr:putative coiled-coil protein MTMR15 [Rhizoctonia solani 123E]
MQRNYFVNCESAMMFFRDEDFDPPVKEEEVESSENLLGTGDIGTTSSQTDHSRSIVLFLLLELLEMIETVLENESHLFSSSEILILNGIKRANYFQQYLISRIVQRKRGKWLRFDQLNESYAPEFRKHAAESDVPKIMADALLELSGHFSLEERPSISSGEKDVIDLTLDSDDEYTCAPNYDATGSSRGHSNATAPPTSSDSTSESVIFLEDTSAATPAQLLECLNVDELKLLGKRLKISSKTKSAREELINAILRSTSTQTTLPFAIVSKASNSSSKKNGNDWAKLFPFKPPQASGKAHNMPLQERRIRDMCSEMYGACFRLLDAVVQALHLVSVVYFRSTEQSEANSIMLSAILSLSGKRNYPTYEFKRSSDIFPTRTDLLRYMEISLLLNEVENLLAGVGQPQGAKFDRLKASQDVINIWETHWDRWNLLVAYLKDKSHRERGLERFEEGYLLTRLAYKAAECFGALKKYDMEAKLLVALLRQTRWRRTKRGRWYDRLALIYTRYMGGGEANLRQAREYLLTGLNDDLVSLGSRPMILRRLQRLEKQLRLPLEEQYVGEGDLKVAVETWIEGTRIYTPKTSIIPPQGAGVIPKMAPSTMDKAILMHVSGSSSSLPTGGNNQRSKWTGKTIWAGEEDEVNVETIALEHYARLGFKGFHSEGTIVLTLFGLLFWDILFAPVLGAFETPYQSAPLDLIHDSFFGSREELINARLDELRSTPDATRIAKSVYSREREREPWCVGVRWDLFEHEEELTEVVECLGGPGLAAICRLLAEEYGSRRGGVPDLFVWNATQKTCKFIEVKGPGDNLSETQKVWIDVLLSAGVDVEVCRVYEHGKMPTRTAKGKNKTKGKSQRRSTSRKRTPKAPKDVHEDKTYMSDPEPEEEEDELQSSSEDEADAVESTLQELYESQHTSKAVAPVATPASPGTCDPLEANLTMDHVKQISDAGPEHGPLSKIKSERSPKNSATPSGDLLEANPSDPAPILGPEQADTLLLRPITSFPAPTLSAHRSKVSLERLDSVIYGITEGTVTTQETVIPETPQATQHQPSSGCSSLTLAPISIPKICPKPHPNDIPDSKSALQFAPRSNASPQKSHLPSNKEWRDMLKAPPPRNYPRERLPRALPSVRCQ